MKVFLKQLLYFSSFWFIPFVILLAGYIYFDPFTVLRTYVDYSNPLVTPSRDYISTEVFLKNSRRQEYNSFIFGSSRTLAYKVDSWVQYLPGHAKPFVFDASSESIAGIYSKMKLIDSLHCGMKNALIILDRDGSFSTTKNFKNHLYIRHPATSGMSRFAFHWIFLKAYFNPVFLFDFYYYVVTKKYTSFMKGYIINQKLAIDTITNQMTQVDIEDKINRDPLSYYANKDHIFYDRVAGGQEDSIPKITTSEKDILISILNILVKNKTNYKIVISPLYEQKKMNSKDVSLLKNIFGNDVYDFSGKNYFTDSKYNYFEQSHYLPAVGDSILHLVYRKNRQQDTLQNSSLHPSY